MYHWKKPSNGSFRHKKPLQNQLSWRYYWKTKTEEHEQSYTFFYSNFNTVISASATHFLEVSTHISLNADKNDSFRAKKISKVNISCAITVKQKRRCVIRVFDIFRLFWKNLTLYEYIFSERKCTIFMRCSHQ